MPEPKRPLKVFLCHASQDKPAVRELYRRLVHDGVDVWLDETNLLPGMDWQLEIPKAVRSADAIIICLSSRSVTKEGYVQKEIRFALDAADEKPDGTIYLIPVRLDECEIPAHMARWQWVDMFSSDGYRKLRLSLRLRAETAGAAIYSANKNLETESLPAHHRSDFSKAGLPFVQNINWKFAGRMSAILVVVILACAVIFSVGRWMFSGNDQPSSLTLSPTPDPTSSLTSEATAIPTQTATLTPFQPGSLPTATFFVAAPTSTFVIIPTLASLPVFTATSVSTPYSTPSMVSIPAGSFLMGRSGGEGDEAPVHTVVLDTFYMDQFEVTNEMYLVCDLSGSCQRPADTSDVIEGYYDGGKFADYPVVNVSWEMAKTYCEWRGGRLPTEAEWEMAARGGLTGKLYPWGDDSPICMEGARNGAQFKECGVKKTTKAGYFAANGYQLYDMTGNVWEWVNDWYQADYYYSISANSPNPKGPQDGEKRVLRGSSWNDINVYLANRGLALPGTQDNEIGFRCARSAP